MLQDIELQATSSSITVTWGNTDSEEAQTFNNSSTFAEYNTTCLLETSNLQASIILVEPTTSEVTMENLPHSTTYECCVTLHIGRYSTRACNNTATLAGSDSTTTELPSVSVTPQGTLYTFHRSNYCTRWGQHWTGCAGGSASATASTGHWSYAIPADYEGETQGGECITIKVNRQCLQNEHSVYSKQGHVRLPSPPHYAAQTDHRNTILKTHNTPPVPPSHPHPPPLTPSQLLHLLTPSLLPSQPNHTSTTMS